MKKLYLLGIALLAATFAFAQVNQRTITKYVSDAKYVNKVPANKHHVSLTKDAILFQDFTAETFPPEGWDTVCGAQSQGAQHWQRYQNDPRTEETDPIVEQPNAGIQYSDGDGVPRNQDEWLISPAFTVPANAIFSFDYWSNPGWFIEGWSSQFGGDYADINVKISTDAGANWVTIWNEDDYFAIVGQDGLPQMQWQTIMIDLSQYANVTDAKIAIQYVGRDAAMFYVDNLTVETASAAADYELTSAAVTFTPDAGAYAYEGHYSTFPMNEIDPEQSYNLFGGVISNYSTADIAVKMVVNVFDPNGENIFTYTYPNDTIKGGAFDENGVYTAGLDTIYAYVPVDTNPNYVHIISQDAIFPMGNMTELGAGTYTYEISLEPAEGTYANPNNRVISRKHYINITEDCLYSRATDNAEGYYRIGEASYPTFGTLFTIYNPEDMINEIEAYVVGADQGAKFHYEIYELTETGFNYLLQTDSYTMQDSANYTPGYISLTSEDIAEAADFNIPQEIVVVVVAEEKNVYIGYTDSEMRDGSYTLCANDEEGWGFFRPQNHDIMIKLHTCPSDNAVETFTANEIEMYPNPTTGIVNFNNVENATIEVYNMMGQVVANANSNSVNTTIDLSNLANGNYVVRIVKDGEVATSKLNIAR